MHSRIFGVSQPSKKLEVFRHSEDQVYEAMQGYADYVVEQEGDEFFDSWKWIATACGDVLDVRREVQEDKIHHYIIVNRDQVQFYFEKDFEKFQEMVENLSLENYVNFWDSEIYEVEQKLHSTTGFWILDSNNNYVDLTTFKDWLKLVFAKMKAENLEEIEYDIVQVFDYHN